MDEQKFNKYLVRGAVILSALIIGGFIGYGVFDAYYNTTGFLEVNNPFPKAQKTAYPGRPAGNVTIKGNEPLLETSDQAAALKNPIAANSESINRGKGLYITYCAPCHGNKGEGEGLMGTVPALGRISNQEKEDLSKYLSGFLGRKPNISLNFFRDQPDAQLYYTITTGGEIIMPAFKDAMDAEQRWDLINYIKWGLGDSGT